MDKDTIIEAIYLYGDKCNELNYMTDIEDVVTIIDECDSIADVKNWLLENI